MEKLKHVIPSKEYENQAIEYIKEFYEYKSDINGAGGLDRYLDNYDGWLEKLAEDRLRVPNEERVPAETYFLVRESDNKLLGMINIRLVLNEHLKKYGGHIGYGIRPTERQKGYNKVNLYLGLLCCQKHGIKEVLMDCDKENLGSAKTMQALGGILIKEYYDDVYAHCVVQDYKIDVDKALETNKDIYEPLVSHESDYTKVFESENIDYIKLSENLISDYLAMVNSKEVANKISHNPKIYTYEDELFWIRNKLENNALCFSMLEKKTHEYIGNVEIMKIVNNIGEIGITITPAKQNKHYGTEAMKAIIKYGYDNLNLVGFDLNVYKTNPKAINCYKKVGFIEDGVGKTKDDIHMTYVKK